MNESTVVKIERARHLFENTIGEISKSGLIWGNFLDCASRLYKYNFEEQVQIYAQRPDAIACATYDMWNNHFHRYIQRGAKGIALLYEKNGKVSLRHVFDVADTKHSQNKAISIWQFDENKHQEVLKDVFNFKNGADGKSIIKSMADNQAAAVNLPFVSSDNWRELAAKSIHYIVARRCGLYDDTFTDPHFFDNVEKLSSDDFFLVANEIAKESEVILRKIENGVKEYYQKERGKDNEKETRSRDKIQTGGGFSDSRPNTARAENDKTLWNNAPTISEGTSEGGIQPTALDIAAERISGLDRRAGVGDGADVDSADVEDRSGPGQDYRYDGLGRAYESFEKPSGGDSFQGADLPLDETGSDGSIPVPSVGQQTLFPTEEEQIQIIRENTANDPSPEVTEKTAGNALVINETDDSSTAAAIIKTNYVIKDNDLGAGSSKDKALRNIEAIRIIKALEQTGILANKEQQDVLARYVGWGGLSGVFDESSAGWQATVRQDLKELLTEKEYRSARTSTLTAFYTPPCVIKAMYEGLRKKGFEKSNILDPSMGIGYFFGLLPDDMSKSKLYGVELDYISGQISQQLYQNAKIAICGFEDSNWPDNFFDLAISNVPFGGYSVPDRAYDKHRFLIHDYFFAKTLEKVRPGGIIAFVTSKGTLDKANPNVRKYIAQRAELLGAIRLPNNAMLANAGTEVTSDIIFLQKRDRQIDIDPDWVYTETDSNGVSVNQYYLDNPHMILGKMVKDKSMYGKEDGTACLPLPDLDLEKELFDRVENHIQVRIKLLEKDPAKTDESNERDTVDVLPADPSVRNYSYVIESDTVYYRVDSVMKQIKEPSDTLERIKALIKLRDMTRSVIEYQHNNYSDEVIQNAQEELSAAYDRFAARYGCINDKANAKAFNDDSGYFLLCALENFDENGLFISKADIFSKRTIRGKEIPERVDTPMEALILSVTEKACVDLKYMSNLTGLEEDNIVNELDGVIYKNPAKIMSGENNYYETHDEYLSGNVREKLALAEHQELTNPGVFAKNIEALSKVIPEDISASEIDVRLGTVWIDPKYINQFIKETFKPSNYAGIEAKYISYDDSWYIENKMKDSLTNVAAHLTYGTSYINAYEIIEDSLNLRDVRVYKTVIDPNTNKETRVVNTEETAIAQQKQEQIKELFKDWIFKNPERRDELTKEYNRRFNSTRAREFDGSNIQFYGMNPEIQLAAHQKNAIARIILGDNVLLGHEVGAGKTFAMASGIMETKRLGLSQKSMWVVPNHLTEQTASEFLRLYPAANILVAKKKDFETANRKKFCSRIATGEFDAVILGFSQFEKIPISTARQQRLLNEQIDDIASGIEHLKHQKGEHITVKRMERTRKTLEARLDKLNDQTRKDDVVTFEELGIDRLVVDEAHNFKNLYYHTKMRNVAGLAQAEAQKSTDLYLKCRYMDEITQGRGIVFATGTPLSNTMAEMFTMMSYLQEKTLKKMGLGHFDAWASTFGETTTAIELAPEGTGYRSKTRFSKFFNLPELMSVFKEVADIKTADQLNLPRPEAQYHIISVEPTEYQKQLMASLADRASKVHDKIVAPEKDNMLKITTDGRKIGLDQRLYDGLLPDEPSTKVNVCTENIHKIWFENMDQRLTQLVFCDFSTPSSLKKERFNLYDDIKKKLIEKGVPREEIAFIHDADNEQKKKDLFAKVRSGHVRVLIGSTSKMGAGTNVQDKLVAIHDLDCPWRPADLEQRAGRIIRQGNSNEKVNIYRYVTKDTFDAYLYQTLENKQKFISQVMTSKTPMRSCEDMDDSVLKYSEIKALCAGDPRIKEKMDLDIKVARLRLAKNHYISNLYTLEDNLFKRLPAMIAEYENKTQALENDLACRNENTNEQNEEKFSGMVINGTFATKKESAGKAILEATARMAPGERAHLGQYRGFEMFMGYSPINKYYFIELKNESGRCHQVGLGTDIFGNLTRINNCLNGIDAELEASRDMVVSLKKSIISCEEEIKKPFQYDQELKDAMERLSQLDIELNLDMTPYNTHKGANLPNGLDQAFPAQDDRVYEGKVIVINQDNMYQEIAPGAFIKHRHDIVKTLGQGDIGKDVSISYDTNGIACVKQVSSVHEFDLGR